VRLLSSRTALFAILALAGLPHRAGAQAVGSEFQVNTYTTDSQETRPYGGHLVAADASGNFVVVWRSYRQDGSDSGIFGQRYDSAGETLGGEFRVNSFTSHTQTYPSIASDASGNFVIVWHSNMQDGSGYGIFGQRYDSGGVAQGNEFRVNSYIPNWQRHASVASDASGNFVVVWESNQDGGGDGIFGQRYDSGGVPQGNEFRVNSYTTFSQTVPSVASDASGNFVVVWHGQGQGDTNGVFGQRYDSAGGTLGGEFRVNSYTSGTQTYPSIASDASGNVVIVWHSYFGQDGSGAGVFGQRYDSGGVARGAEFRVNSYTPNNQFYSSVASDVNGNFVVAWHSLQNGRYGVFGQRYDSAGLAQGEEFRINSYTSSIQWFPSVAATGTNQFVVVWETLFQDGSDWGIFGQRYDFPGDTTPPSVTVVAPNGGEKLFTGSSYLIRWAASDDIALSSFDVSASVDGGGSFSAIPECQDLPPSATQCLWLAPGPPSTSALIRVTAEDTSGNSASDNSNAVFRIVAGAASVTVTNPNTNVRWRIGSRPTITWTHNLGARSRFRIELDRNNDGTFEELIAAAAPASDATHGSFNWTVTGPPTQTARLRVSWTGNPAISDVSNVTFRIAAQVLD